MPITKCHRPSRDMTPQKGRTDRLFSPESGFELFDPGINWRICAGAALDGCKNALCFGWVDPGDFFAVIELERCAAWVLDTAAVCAEPIAHCSRTGSDSLLPRCLKLRRHPGRTGPALYVGLLFRLHNSFHLLFNLPIQFVPDKHKQRKEQDCGEPVHESSTR